MVEGNRSNLAARLLQIIGSPLESSKEVAINRNEATKLYDFAKTNKIALLYLNAVRAQGKLTEFGLEAEYQREQKRQHDQEITIKRIAQVLDSIGAPYVVFKSIMPFPAVPNDVDVLYLGSNGGYAEVANTLSKSGYEEITHGRVPLCLAFHDAREGPHSNTGEKDPFDVDLYEEVSVGSHLVYLAKWKLGNHITETNVWDTRVKVFEAEAELLGSIAHSIIEAHLYTLLMHYVTLHQLAKMDSQGVSRLMSLARKNNLVFALKVHFSLAMSLEKLARGAIPEKLARIQAELGINQREPLNLQRDGFNLPHHYSLLTIARVLLEKAKEREFSHSAARQAISMLNPKEARRIVQAFVLRRKRTTY